MRALEAEYVQANLETLIDTLADEGPIMIQRNGADVAVLMDAVAYHAQSQVQHGSRLKPSSSTSPKK